MKKKETPIKNQQVSNKDFTKEHDINPYVYKPWVKKMEGRLSN